jgi:hypothetical protein
MSTYAWVDFEDDSGDISCRAEDLEGDAVALIGVTDHSGTKAGVYVNAEQAKAIEAFLAGVVMSLPAEQRA